MRFPQAELFPASQEHIKVGGLYATLSTANPADELGYGVWQAFGAGRCLVGVDAGDADFDAPGKESGAKTHTLALTEVPAHAHANVTDGGTTVNNGAGNAFATVNQAGAVGSLSTGGVGGGQPHNNVQPSIAVFLWRRTA